MTPFFYAREFGEYLKAERRFSPHTILAYTRDVEAFFHWLSGKGITENALEVTRADIREWMMERMDEGMSPASVSRKLSAIRSYYRLLVRSGVCPINPAQGVRSPQKGSKVPVFVSEDSADRMQYVVETEAADFSDVRDRVIMELLYGTGIRLAELIGLRLSDVRKQEILVRGKRNKERLVPLHPDLMSVLSDYIVLRKATFPGLEHDALILLENGKKVYPKFVYRKVNYYIGLVSTVPKKSPHVLRHSFATHMLNSGADLNGIKEILGHSSLRSTQVYTHNTFEKLKMVHSSAHPRGTKS
jgi:integrase/recombinase XerC